ncbi:MAG: alpha/beta fold hydrolase [Planctomycetota bacterium]
MQSSRSPLAFGLLATLLLCACASRPISERPAKQGEVLRELQRSIVTDDEVSALTQQVLDVHDLAESWERRPSETPEALLEVTSVVPIGRRRTALAELYFALGKSAKRPADALPLYVESVLTAREQILESNSDIAAFDPEQQLLAVLYNWGLSRVAVLAQEVQGPPGSWTDLPTLGGPRPVTFVHGPKHHAPEYFDAYLAASEWNYSGRLPHRYRSFGVGAPLVGVRHEGGESGRTFGAYELPLLQTLPVTLLLDVATDGTLELHLVDAFSTRTLEVEGERLPLAADFSAPLGHLIAQYDDANKDKSRGFFAPEKLEAERGIYMLQPYDPERIPLLLVHGLWSSPLAWIEVINEVYGDDELREAYQVWLYLYPTGLEIPDNMAALHAQLHQMRVDLDPELDDPAMQDMVVVGHSMGGVLAKTLVSTGGDQLWNAVARVPVDELDTSPEEREELRRMAYFEPMPFVNRAVFIAAPHRGASMADNWVGSFGKWLIDLPAATVASFQEMIERNPEAFIGYDRMHTSIDDLSPSSTALRGLTDCPIREGLPYHTIMGDVTGKGAPNSDDGVVAYASSHLEGARSELVVDYEHGAQRHPLAQLEIRRILHEHLAERE